MKTYIWKYPTTDKKQNTTKPKKDNPTGYDEEKNMDSIFTFLKSNYPLPSNYEFRDYHTKNKLITYPFYYHGEPSEANGTADFFILPKTATEMNATIKMEILVVIEIKQPLLSLDNYVPQIIIETISSNSHSRYPVLGVLTNLVDGWKLYWSNKTFPITFGYCTLRDERNFSKAITCLSTIFSPTLNIPETLIKNEIIAPNDEENTPKKHEENKGEQVENKEGEKNDNNDISANPNKKPKTSTPTTTATTPTTTTKQHSFNSQIDLWGDIANLDDIPLDNESEKRMLMDYKTKFLIENILVPLFKDNS
ncbi:pleckstrin (PH) domain-containing protein [Tieghemostelium lacteum]|uniref:Pleckstrin (PH) domain-containing protein n=1 Tax=Tieghemostelium lacteum TaxID=361077 RepID=A0A151Z7R0_TIELA|nr:pleckstrin (PH) domain-containing protein [Tieghemostelium lacteum]|eukprot:KYQ90003.1 pleckstrin (PH) domain-containing protein [Tieghemostelium lacteum]